MAQRAWANRRRSGSNAVANMLGIDDAIARANRLARLLDDDMPLGRAIATDGPIDRLLRPGGVVDMLTAHGGLLDRLTAEGGGLQRALKPGGLVDQLLAEDGLIDRVLAEDGLADRLLAEGGLIDKLTARTGRSSSSPTVADTLSRLAPGMEALEPAIATLQDAVIGADHGGQPAEQHRRADSAARAAVPDAAHSSSRTVRSQRVIDRRRHEPLGWHPVKTGLLSSVVEHSPCKRAVVSSILTGGSVFIYWRRTCGQPHGRA